MIKMLVMDVDGTLTDGHIYIGAEGEMMKVAAGDTLLIAAENKRLEVDGNIKLLETHISQ